MTIPTPSVGRIVLYTLGQGPNMGQVRPAIITRVRQGDSVDLHVFLSPDDGLHGEPIKSSVCRCNTPESTQNEAAGMFGCWHWMPFQVHGRPA